MSRDLIHACQYSVIYGELFGLNTWQVVLSIHIDPHWIISCCVISYEAGAGLDEAVTVLFKLYCRPGHLKFIICGRHLQWSKNSIEGPLSLLQLV